MTDPDAPQPRDIAVEQPSPELLEELEQESAPADQYGDQHDDRPDDQGAGRP